MQVNPTNNLFAETGADVTDKAANIPAFDFPDFAAFVASLPAKIQTVGSLDLRHIHGIARRNAQTAWNLENRRDELAAIFGRLLIELEAGGLSFADVTAFERERRDVSVFPNAAPYVIPEGYDRYGYKSPETALKPAQSPETGKDTPEAKDAPQTALHARSV